jgi:oxygen-independent coproporphyrinogen-3 oxidase
MADPNGFGLYVHWPFCQSKCPYCDFNSHVSNSIDQAQWREAYASELRRAASETDGRVLDTIFFGGGTPSLMDAETVALIIDTARAVWRPSNHMEITLEANPTSVEAARFAAYADAGVNRVSVGVQSLRDHDLKALGRRHSAREALLAVEIAKKAFERVSFDIIYARQNQSLADWELELDEALSLGPDHLSLYQLTIEDGTAFGDRFSKGGLRGLPDEDLAADMFEMTQEMTGRAGLGAYEISNHAAPGQESRHNLIYWKSGDWVGIGPGAHGRLSLGSERIRTETHLLPSVWLKSVAENGSGESGRESLTTQESLEETVMMGLRLSEGIPVARLPDDILIKIRTLVDDGLLIRSSEQIRTSPKGRPVLNYILREILA